MLESLITSKLRVKLLYKFFINPEVRSYLRGLSDEFNVSSNTVRKELNKLESAGMLIAENQGNKKMYEANRQHPLFSDLRNLLMKTVGVEQVIKNIIRRLGNPQKVYLTGDLARGIDSSIIDLYIIGEIDRDYLNKLVVKVEKMISKKIRFAVFSPEEWDEQSLYSKDTLLIYDGLEGKN